MTSASERKPPIRVSVFRMCPSFLRGTLCVDVVDPPARDVRAACEPDIAARERVLDEFPKRGGAGRLPGASRVHADGHHFWRPCRTFSMQLVESPPRKIEEAAGAASSLTVVVGRCVWDHEMALAADRGEVGEVVVVGIRVVEEAAVFDKELAR